jgi:hypothetical protein
MFTKTLGNFQTFDVRAIVEESEDTQKVLKKGTKVESLPEIRVDRSIHPDMTRPTAHVVSKEEAGPELKRAMIENKIRIAPAADTVDLKKLVKAGGAKIPPPIIATMNEYDYYNVKMGLNIL